MGRPQSFRSATIHKMLNDNEANVIKNKKIVPPSSPIWNTLFESLAKENRPSNSKAIYTCALKWFAERIESPPEDINLSNSGETTVCNEINLSVTKNESSTDNDDDSSTIRFKIELSYKV